MLSQFAAALVGWSPSLPPVPTDSVSNQGTTIEVVDSIDVAAAPHGMTFDDDGRVYLACAGADRIAVIDPKTRRVEREIAAGSVPLDVVMAPDGASLWITQFRGNAIVKVSVKPDAATQPLVTLAPGPSLFSPPARGVRYVVCEEADRVFAIYPSGRALRSWRTAGRPYPADVTQDGILVFVPCRDDGVVRVIDTLNERHVTDVAVGARPEGGTMTVDDVSYVAACGGADELVYVNTASFEVTDRVADVGPRPFAVTRLGDGRHALVNNAGGSTVSVLDVADRRIVGTLAVGEMPIVVRVAPDGRHAYVACEGDHTVSILRIDRPTPTRDRAPTEVLVLGMIHSGHRTSERYGLDVVRAVIRSFAPDDVCTEIPPNRLRAAQDDYRADGVIAEERVRLFPEYTEVLFPLQAEMDFTIVPCAGWTTEMNDYRRAQLRAIVQDPARADAWAEHQAAMTRLDKEIAALGHDDDPELIHSEAYDAAIDRGFEPYDRHFNEDLGDGGWDHINAKHYALIAAHLDRVRGQGRRVIVTFGAAHKSWFLRALRERDDVRLVDVDAYLP